MADDDGPYESSLTRRDYLDAEQEVLALTPSGTGLPDLRLVERHDRLVLTTPTGGVINPHSRHLYKSGIVIFAVRGTKLLQGRQSKRLHPWNVSHSHQAA